jgi:hypothetical protein
MLKMPRTMKAAEAEQEAARRLAEVLRGVPFLSSMRIESLAGPHEEIDFAISIRSRSGIQRLLCEVKLNGQPRIVREACRRLRGFIASGKKGYPVLIAPYLSPEAASICAESGVGYLDFAGNCRLVFDQVFILREGYPNSSVEKRELRSLYSPKAERVLRVLLNAGPRSWKMKELADEACVSLGQVANVKKLLLDREWIVTAGTGLALSGYSSGSPDGSGDGAGSGYGFGSASGAGGGDGSGMVDGSAGAIQIAVLPLLLEWARSSRLERSKAAEFYSMRPIPECEAALGATPGVALTGLAGAARLAPAVRYQRLTAYVQGDVMRVAGVAGFKSVATGGNITLMEPYDDGVFFGAQVIDGVRVVSPIQVYLDLANVKGRGEEAAAAILEEVIKPLWR